MEPSKTKQEHPSMPSSDQSEVQSREDAPELQVQLFDSGEEKEKKGPVDEGVDVGGPNLASSPTKISPGSPIEHGGSSSSIETPAPEDASALEEDLALDGSIFLADDFSIGALLARGCLIAPILGEQTESPFFDVVHPHLLPRGSSSIPTNWVDAVTEHGRPIAVLCSGAPIEASRCLILEEVEALCFRTEKHRKWVKARPRALSEWTFEGTNVRLSTDANLFCAPNAVVPPAAESTPPLQPLRVADAVGAVRAVLLVHAPPRKHWIHGCLRALDLNHGTDERGARWIASLLAGLHGESSRQVSIGEAVIACTAQIITERYALGEGWPASEILSRVVEGIGDWLPSDFGRPDRAVLDRWIAQASDILAGRAEPSPLLDEGNIPLRAVLFLLLRADLDDILDHPVGEHSKAALRVGADVRMLAGCLAASRYGLRDIPVESKRVGDWYLPVVLGAMLAEDMGLRTGVSPKWTFSEERRGLFQSTWSLKVDGHERRWNTTVPDGLSAYVEALVEPRYSCEPVGLWQVQFSLPTSGGDVEVLAGPDERVAGRIRLEVELAQQARILPHYRILTLAYSIGGSVALGITPDDRFTVTTVLDIDGLTHAVLHHALERTAEAAAMVREELGLRPTGA